LYISKKYVAKASAPAGVGWVAVSGKVGEGEVVGRDGEVDGSEEDGSDSAGIGVPVGVKGWGEDGCP
jgi:hypothetical protein